MSWFSEHVESWLAWAVIGAGVGSLLAAGLVWAAGRLAGRDDRLLRQTRVRRQDRPDRPETEGRRELRKTDRL